MTNKKDATTTIIRSDAEDNISRSYVVSELRDLADEFNEVDENGLHSERWCGVLDSIGVVENAPPAAPNTSDEASPLTAEHMITFEGKPIDPAKPLYVVCGRFSKKKNDGFPLKRTEQSICFPFIKAYRGYISAIHFDPDNPGIAIRLDLWFNAMDSSKGCLIAGNEYFFGTTAQEARKAYQKSMKGKNKK